MAMRGLRLADTGPPWDPAGRNATLEERAVTDVQGEVHPEFAELGRLLGEQVLRRGHGGAALAVYHRGAKVVDAWAGARDAAGSPWQEDTIALSQSTTKGVLAAAVALGVDRGLLDYDATVASVWPEFARCGKEDLLLRDVMAHEAGLFRVRHLVGDASELGDWDRMAARLAGERPVHPRGVANGYHGLTLAWLAGEPLRRAAGRSVGRFVREEIAGPLALDGLFIGVPDAEMDRLADPVVGTAPPNPLLPPSTEAPPAAGSSDDDAGGVFPLRWRPENARDAIRVRGLDAWVASKERARAEIPSVSGCFTARALARLYAALAAGGTLDGVRLWSPATLERATREQNDRPDLVLAVPVRWRLGWHAAFTSAGALPGSFAHYGFGGSGAFADPRRELAFGFVTNTLSGGALLGDDRLASLGAAAVRAADARD